LYETPAELERGGEHNEIIFKAFNEESFSHKGKYYTRIYPRACVGEMPLAADPIARPR
jgi:hypothetical protein